MVKFSHIRYRALGPELILMYKQSAHRLSSDSRLPLLSARPKRSPDGATPNWGNMHPITVYYSSIDPEINCHLDTHALHVEVNRCDSTAWTVLSIKYWVFILKTRNKQSYEQRESS